MDSLFPTAEAMEALTEFVPTFVAYGMGLAVLVWAIGYVVWFIIDFVR